MRLCECTHQCPCNENETDIYDLGILLFKIQQLSLTFQTISHSFLHRECKETVTIKGFTIPAGTVVETPPWVLHHDPGYWPEPNKFDPDR